MDLYSRLMGIEEVIEYLNEKTDRDFNQDKTLKFIKEKNIPIVFEYEGWATYDFKHEGEYQSCSVKVNGYFSFRNSSDAVQIFKGFLEEINIGEAIIYQLDSYQIRNNVPDGIKPKQGDALLFKTGGRSPMFSNLNTQNTIKIDNDKIGVLKKDLEEYLNKMKIEHMDNKTKIEILESTIEQLEAEKATLKYQQTEALAAANAKIKQQEQDIKKLNDKLDEQIDSPADKPLYDWQAMNRYTYPPELHLAMEIWKEYYQADVIKHITQFDSGRFNRISTKLNLSKGNLKERIRTILTPLNSKTKSRELLSSLEVINIIHNDKLEQD